MNTLEVDSVRLNYSGRSILSNVYLSNKTGEITGLIGRNGCGKSSLMKIIFGSLRAENQSVRINKTYFHRPFTEPQLLHYLPQDLCFPTHLKFQTLMKLFEINEYENQLMQFDEVSKSQSQPIGLLSGGARKLVEILILLYTPGKFLLLDEPFSFLSPVLVEKLSEHIKYVSSRKGIILTDHQYKSVFSIASHYYVLNDGATYQIHGKQDLIRFGYLSVLD